MPLAFRILNVFTVDGDRFSGNPLCVVEDARGLSDTQMQALALQMNLSETTFIIPPEQGSVPAVRIFTPSFEMPFAGHPTLGTAYVARSLFGLGDDIALDMKVGRVEVKKAGTRYTLRTAKAPAVREPESSPGEIATMLHLAESDLAGPPRWIDTGAEQLVIPLRSEAAVRAASPDAAGIAKHGFSARRGASMAYVFAEKSPETTSEHRDVLARFFFKKGMSVIEDPATGSACANLGGYLLSRGLAGPFSRTVSQGAEVSRPSRLFLSVDADRNVFVGGDVIELGRGALDLLPELTSR